MKLAWLRARAATDESNPLDPTAQLLAVLRADHDIDVVVEARAHDVVWRHARDPFDLFVHELGDTPEHTFIAGYAVHYPGVLLLSAPGPHHGRAIQASRQVVVGDAAMAESLAATYPQVAFTAAPIGVAAIAAEGAPPADDGGPLRVGVLDPGARGVVERAMARGRQAGARLEAVDGGTLEVLTRADVIVAIEWPPPAGPPVAALAGMAAGRAVIVLETLVTAGWPALDPQTWTVRGAPSHAGAAAGAAPIVISLDPRDEEHSLMLALRRLAADPALRRSLGLAARGWWHGHATISHAVDAWRRILSAPALPPAPPFRGADGTEHARGVLAAFGVTVDFL